jgi:hypothetical protein
MPIPRKPRPLGRYSRTKVILEIEEQFRRRGRGSKKALAAGLGFKPPEITKRQNDDEAHWNFEELGRVAEEWQAPAGWPFIPWDEAYQRDEAWRKHLARKQKPE